MNGIFDSHAHYDDKQFDIDRDQIISNLERQGVVGVINVGCNIKTSKSSICLANKYSFFYCSVGIHPHEAENVDGDYIDILEELSKNNKVMAIGEIGLDYHYKNIQKQIQKRVFINQLKLAEKLDLPVIIHSRDALEDTLEILKEFSNVKGVVHCYSYDKDSAIELINMGYYLGITGAITFNNAKNLKDVVYNVPISNILLETDCPYMAPVPFRGKRCDSSMIINSVKEISKLKVIEETEIIKVTTANCYNIFKIKS